MCGSDAEEHRNCYPPPPSFGDQECVGRKQPT